MKIDTLILCGNAEKALSFLGSLTALFEKNIIKKKKYKTYYMCIRRCINDYCYTFTII